MNGPLDYFQVEAGERIERLQGLLAEWRPGADSPERLDDLFRQAHSLKGAAGVAGAGSVADLCHLMEDVLGRIRAGEAELDAELVELLAASTGRVQVLVGVCASGGEPPPDTAGCRERLEAWLAEPRPSGGEPGAASTATGLAQPAPELVGTGNAQPPPEVAGTGDAEPPPAPAAEQSESAPHVPPAALPAHESPASPTVRVRLSILDGLRERSGELMVAGEHLNQRLSDALEVRRQLRRCRADASQRDQARALRAAAAALDGLVEDLAADSALLAPLIHDLHARAMDACMLPVSHLFEPFKHFVREYCHAAGRSAVLAVDGAGVRVDRCVMEQLHGALVHLLRNALAHGIETPDQRRAAGKDPVGRITLRSFNRGERVAIVCEDDGRGICRERVCEQAVRNGLISADRASRLSDEEIHALLLQPGFSTALDVDQFSGRGVGLDEVARAVEALSGSLRIESEAGRYTRFVIEVAAGATTLKGVVVLAGGHHYVLPATQIIQGIRIRRNELRFGAGGLCFVDVDGVAIPLLRLAALAGAPAAVDAPQPGLALVISHGDALMAVAVEQIVGTQSVVTSRLAPHIGASASVIGATILSTGHPALVLDPALLADAGGAARAASRAPAASPPSTASARLLVVDDSLTTRMMEQNILAAAGYTVDTAVSAEDALAKTALEHYDLIVTDVEMPGLNGFELSRRLRGDTRHRETPIVVVSSLGTDDHRREGYEAGANAYIVKGQFDQNELLATVAGLLS